MNKKYITSALLAAALFTTATGCTENKENTTAENTTAAVTESSEEAIEVKALSSTAESTAAYTITFTDTAVTSDIASAVIDGTKITLTEPVDGDIEVSGTCSDGQIYVNIDKESYPESSLVLELNGLALSNDDNSPIYVASVGDKCEIKVKEASENTISDGKDYLNEDSEAAAIYSKADLKFTGKGSLTVYGNTDAGIQSKDDIKIYNGSLTVRSAGTGIKGKDSVVIGDPDKSDNYETLAINVTSTNGDGIKSTNADEEGKGNVEINGGAVNITSNGDGIQSEKEMDIKGGTLNLTVTGEDPDEETTDTSAAGEAMTPPEGGEMPQMNQDGNTAQGEASQNEVQAEDEAAVQDNEISAQSLAFELADTAVEDEESGAQPPQMPEGEMPQDGEMPQIPQGMEGAEDGSGTEGMQKGFGAMGGGFGGGMGGMMEGSASSNGYKGIKAGTSLNITGGTINITSSGHSIKSGSDMTITGGSITTNSETGKGIVAHGNLNIGSEGTEGPDITVEQATEGIESKTVMTIDSGNVYVNNASDDGLNTGGTESTDHSLIINGGYVYVNAKGDGIDSNSVIYFNGGTTVVNGPANNGNSSVDSMTGVAYNGGTMIAVGSAGMMAGDSFATSDSSKGYIMSTSANVTDGDEITVTDEKGNVILHYTVQNSALANVSCGVLVSSDKIESEGSYKLYVGGKYTEGTAVGENGLYTGGKFSASGATEHSQTEAAAGMMGGMGGMMGGQMPGGMTGTDGTEGTAGGFGMRGGHGGMRGGWASGTTTATENSSTTTTTTK